MAVVSPKHALNRLTWQPTLSHVLHLDPLPCSSYIASLVIFYFSSKISDINNHSHVSKGNCHHCDISVGTIKLI